MKANDTKSFLNHSWHVPRQSVNCKVAICLIVSSMKPVQLKDSKHCTVIYGEWDGVYTGKTFTKTFDVDIDHIAPRQSPPAEGDRVCLMIQNPHSRPTGVRTSG